MAEESAKLRVPYIAASQAQKHVTHNEAMTLLDTLVQLSVLDKDLTTPPAEPEEGDTYIVAGSMGGATGTGAWLGWDARVARYIDGAWRSYLPGQGDGAGWLAYVIDEQLLYRFDGMDWGRAFDSFVPDVTVDAIGDRDDYDEEAANFSVLVAADATNDGQPTLYFKLSAVSAEWSVGIVWQPQGGEGPPGQSFQPDAVVAAIGDRDPFDDEAAAFSVLVVADSGNDDKPTLYFKLSGASADWSDGITWEVSGVANAAGIGFDPAGLANTDATDVQEAITDHDAAISGKGSLTSANTWSLQQTFSSAINLASGQIAFPATQNPSANANTLDDYEEGTWTPAVSFGNGTTGITYGTRTATYTKVGRYVFAGFRISLTSKGTSTGAWRVTGLPFTVGNNHGFGLLKWFSNFVGLAGQVIGDLQSGNTTMILNERTATGVSQLTNAHATDTSNLYGAGIYED
jgi:hypothetical protein